VPVVAVILLLNIANVSQPAAELLRVVEKFKMAASAIMNYYLIILDHPQSLLVHRKLHVKFRVDSAGTFQDIVI